MGGRVPANFAPIANEMRTKCDLSASDEVNTANKDNAALLKRGITVNAELSAHVGGMDPPLNRRHLVPLAGELV